MLLILLLSCLFRRTEGYNLLSMLTNPDGFWFEGTNDKCYLATKYLDVSGASQAVSKCQSYSTHYANVSLISEMTLEDHGLIGYGFDG